MDNTGDDTVVLLRLRMLKPPPTWIQLDSTSTMIDLTIGLQDDYGVDVDTLGLISLSISVVDSTNSHPVPHIVAAFVTSPSSPASPDIVIDSSSIFHALSVRVSSSKPLAAGSISTIRFLVTAQALDSAATNDGLSKDALGMMALVGEADQKCCACAWDDETQGIARKRYVLMRVLSGNVEVRWIAGSANQHQREPSRLKLSKNKKSIIDSRISSNKVQTVIRQIHLRSPSQLPDTTFSVLEIPSLLNSTGQRLWDCAIGLSLYLSITPSSLLPRTSYSSPPPSSPAPFSILERDGAREPKRPRLISSTSAADSSLLDRRSLKVLELGSGCGLVSLVALHLLHTPSSLHLASFEVIASDVAATVETTLMDNLHFNDCPSASSRARGRIRSEVLEWGTSGCDDDRRLKKMILKDEGVESDLTIVASDVLYNPDFHLPFLETLLLFLRPRDDTGSIAMRQALIAYKHRTGGDSHFFELARQQGLFVDLVWTMGVIEVWRLQ